MALYSLRLAVVSMALLTHGDTSLSSATTKSSLFDSDSFTVSPLELITVISPRDLNNVQHLTCSVCFHHTNKPGSVSFQWTGAALTGEEASTAQDSVGCAGVQKRSTVQVKVSILLKYLWLRCSVVIDNRIQRQRTFILNPRFGGQHADKHSLVSDHTIPIDSETKELTVPCWAVSHQGLTIRPTDEPDFKQRLIDYSVTDIVLRSNSSGFYSASHSNGFTDDPIQVKLLRIHFSGDSFKAAKLCPLDSTTLRWRCKTKWQASKGRHRSVKFRTLMAFSGPSTGVVMCPRARPVKAANGLPIPLSCFTPASYGNQVIWLHNNRPLPNKPWWVTSRVGRTGPHDTLEHHLKLSASLSDDSGNITCKVVGSGDGVQQHISASVDVKIGGRRMRHELLLPLTIECGRSSATLRTAVRDDTGWPGYFEIINASANANITGRSWRDSTRSKNSAFYRYHSVMEVFGVLSQVVKGSYVRFCLNQGTKRTCPVQQLVSDVMIKKCEPQIIGNTMRSPVVSVSPVRGMFPKPTLPPERTDFTILPSEITVISPRDLNDVQHLTCSVCFHHTNKPGNVSFQWTGALTGEEASTAQDSVGCAGVQKRSTVQVKVSVLLKYLWLRCSVVIDNRIQRQRTFILDPKFGAQHASTDGLLLDRRVQVDSMTRELVLPCWASSEVGLHVRYDEDMFKQRLIDYSVTNIVLGSTASGYFSTNKSNDFARDKIHVQLLLIKFSGDAFKIARVCPSDGPLRWRCRTTWRASHHQHRKNSSVQLRTRIEFNGSLTRAVMCPRARPLKSANGLRINVTCFTPASYGNPVVWLHNNLPVPNKPWWIVSSPSLAGPRNTLAHHLKLSAGLSDDSGNITCQVLGSGDGAQPHLSASVDIAIGGRRTKYKLLQKLTSRCDHNTATNVIHTVVRDDTDRLAHFEVDGVGNNVIIANKTWRDSDRGIDHAFHRYHFEMTVASDARNLTGYTVRFCTHGECPLIQHVSDSTLTECKPQSVTASTRLQVSTSGSSQAQLSSVQVLDAAGTKSSMLLSVVLAASIAGVAVGITGFILVRHGCMKRRKHGRSRTLCTTDMSETDEYKRQLHPKDLPLVMSHVEVPPNHSATSLPIACQQMWLKELSVFLDEEWHIPPAQINNVVPLSSGEFGEVLKGMISQDNAGSYAPGVVALKKAKDKQNSNSWADLLNELEVLKCCGRDHHPNIIGFLGVTVLDGSGVIVLEFAEYGNLHTFLRQRFRSYQAMESDNGDHAFLPPYYVTAESSPAMSGKVPSINRHQPTRRQPSNSSSTSSNSDALIREYDVYRFASQIVSAMEHLASLNCVHRDLAARNILIDGAYTLKVADFGLARQLKTSDYYEICFGERSIPAKWHPPESLLERVFYLKSDIWSFGVVLWEIATLGTTPYQGVPSSALASFLMEGDRLEQPEGCSNGLYKLMCQCWNLDPDQRPSFTELAKSVNAFLAYQGSQKDEGDLIYLCLESQMSESSTGR